MCASRYKPMNYKLQWNSSYEATPFAPERWPFKRCGLLSGVEINTFMFRFTLSNGHYRMVGLSSGWPLKRGSTILPIVVTQISTLTLDYGKLHRQGTVCPWGRLHRRGAV